MTKSERIELLEQRVAELIGDVHGLTARIETLEAGARGWWSIKPYPNPPYIPMWTLPNTSWPYQITNSGESS